MENLSQIDFLKFSDTLLQMTQRLESRDHTILVYRFGLGDEVNDPPVTNTLEEIGSKFGLTRERIRQLQARSFRKLRNDENYPLIERFFSAWNNLGRSAGCDITAREFISVASLCEMVPAKFPQACINFVAEISGYRKPNSNLLILLSKLDDAVVSVLSEQISPLSLEDLLQMVVIKELMDDISTVVPEFDIRLRLEAILGVDIDAKDMCSIETSVVNSSNFLNDREVRLAAIKRVLASEGHPMHFRDIQGRITEELPPDLYLTERNVHAWLDRNKDIFSWTGMGTYGLKEWGMGLSTDHVAGRRRGIGDEISAILRSASQPVHYDDIKKVILNNFNVREASILAAIRQDPTVRFVELPDGYIDLSDRQTVRELFGEGSLDLSAARKILIDYRETYLVQNYPDVPREHGLLRKSMLDSFLYLLPTSIIDFSDKIPEDLLRNTHQSQIEDGLEYVISICRRVEN